MPFWNRATRDPDLDAELKRLNQAVDDAVAARKAWMDAHMQQYSKHQVGDVLYDLTTGRCVGTVSALYRVHADDQRFDRSMSVDLQIRLGGLGNCHDNTSRQPHVSMGTAADLAACLAQRAEDAKRLPEQERNIASFEKWLERQ